MDQDPAVNTRPAVPRALRAVSVLVIDDDIDTHDMLGVLLAHAGFSVATACNGREALVLLSTVRPGLILLDIEMPVMTGPELSGPRVATTAMRCPTMDVRVGA